MVILALLSFPILSAFSNSAKMNRMARQEENANAVAADMAEEFKASTLEDLKNKYSYVVNGDGTYTFTDKDSGNPIVKSGNNGESYQVEVVLDPTAYVTPEGETAAWKDINSYDTPSYNSLNNENNLVIMDKISMYDDQALAKFGVASKNGITKNLKLMVEIQRDTYDKKLFTVSTKGTVTYTRAGVSHSFDFQMRSYTLSAKDLGDSTVQVSKDEKLKGVYLFYTPYSANDSIDIEYKYPHDADVKLSDFDVYLIEQKSGQAAGYVLDASDITMKVNDASRYKNVQFQTYGTVDLSDVLGTAGPVSLYSNVNGWSAFRLLNKRSNGLTTNQSIAGDSKLYTMIVKVSREGKEIVSVSTTKENM